MKFFQKTLDNSMKRLYNSTPQTAEALFEREIKNLKMYLLEEYRDK